MYVKVVDIRYVSKKSQRNVLIADHGFWKGENARKILLK